MLSFPSTLNTGGSNINLPTIPHKTPSDILKNIGRSFVNSAVNTLVGGIFGAANNSATRGADPDLSRLPYDYTRNVPALLEKTNIQ